MNSEASEVVSNPTLSPRVNGSNGVAKQINEVVYSDRKTVADDLSIFFNKKAKVTNEVPLQPLVVA